MSWTDWNAPGLQACVVEAGDGRRWRLVLSTPPGEPPAGGWPLLWGLDGDSHGLTLIETARRLGRRPETTGVGPLAVALVMPADGPSDPALRHAVFTAGPPADPSLARGSWETGGALALLDVLTGEGHARLRERLVEAGPAAIWGHSLSGWFALWAAGAAPSAFRGVAAISPSLWWDEAVASPHADARVFLAVGGKERDDRADGRRMTGRATALHGRLAGEGRAVCFRVFDGEDHASIVSASMAAALRTLSA